ncbi:MAG: FAD-dependent monooxygenase [Rivularia sp. (in: Bacteria)]|nr:FAD-dependent monooxygenase [Rivularia sp. MS3]
MKTDVIIIGAGPTGLSLACQLIRYGIDFVIIEKNASITHLSKALGVHARTLEIYEQLGLAKQAVKQGAIAEKLRLIAKGKIRDGINLSDTGKNLSPYPYMLVLEQSKNEQLLYDYLQSHQKEVLWNTTLESFSQDDTGVLAVVKNDENPSQTIEAKYLVGCDGARSQVRKSLGLSFTGSTLEEVFYVADMEVDWDIEDDSLYACLGKDSFVGFFPMEGEKCWRIVGNLPQKASEIKASAGEIEVDYEEIEQKIRTQTQLDFDIIKVNWFSSYLVHSRRVEQFSQGRCFLAGDAAHIHTPAGGQGMNTGIQDAYNLVWKLAFVLKGYARESLLDSYNQERLENANNLLETTDEAFELGAGSDFLVSFIRTVIIPPLAKHIFKLGVVQRSAFSLLSQIGISYPDSVLSNHSDDSKLKVKAGDRMPYFLVDGKSIYDKLHQPLFHLITFSDGRNPEQDLTEKIEYEYNHLVDYHSIPLYPHIAEIFGTNESFSILLRPDNYIGFISQNVSLDKLENYFAKNEMQY